MTASARSIAGVRSEVQGVKARSANIRDSAYAQNRIDPGATHSPFKDDTEEQPSGPGIVELVADAPGFSHIDEARYVAKARKIIRGDTLDAPTGARSFHTSAVFGQQVINASSSGNDGSNARATPVRGSGKGDRSGAEVAIGADSEDDMAILMDASSSALPPEEGEQGFEAEGASIAQQQTVQSGAAPRRKHFSTYGLPTGVPAPGAAALATNAEGVVQDPTDFRNDEMKAAVTPFAEIPIPGRSHAAETPEGQDLTGQDYASEHLVDRSGGRLLKKILADNEKAGEGIAKPATETTDEGSVSGKMPPSAGGVDTNSASDPSITYSS